MALIDAKPLNNHQLERIHLLLIDDASRGLADVAAHKVKDARTALTTLKHHRGLPEDQTLA